MTPEDNPMDDVQITKEQRQAGEIERLTAANAKLVEELDEIKKVATHYSDARMNGHYQQVAGEILAIVARS